MHSIYKLLTWLILLLGLAGSGMASYWMKVDAEARAYQQFSYDCEEIKLAIEARLKAHEQTLLSGAAMFDASETVTRQEWQSYVKLLRINEHFNGIQGLGFSLWIPAAQLSAHKARIRAEGFPDYKVRPEDKRDAYTSIIFLEPFSDRNLRAFGYDMYSEPVRRTAMERARDENTITLSKRVTLVQETDKDIQAGTLMYAPVYRKNQPIDTVEQRRAALFGWVYSPFRINDLLTNIVLPVQKNNAAKVQLRVYDGDNTQADHLLYASHKSVPDNISDKKILLTSNFNGTIWTLQFEQIAGAGAADYSKAWITLITGFFISILLFLLSYSYLNTRINAILIAARLTEQLQESESRFRLLADSAPVLIWLAGTDKLCYQFNKGWFDFTGHTSAQETGNGWTEGVHTDDLQHCMDTYNTAFDGHLPFKMEYRLRRYDNEYRWLLDTGVPRFADDGVFLGYIGSCVDITELKHAEAELRASENKFRALVEKMPLPLGFAKNTGELLYINDRFTEQFGYTLEDIPNHEHWYLLAYPDKKYRHKVIRIWQTVINQAIDSATDIEPREYNVTCKNGDVRVVVISGIFVEDNLILTFIDITERKQAEIRIEKSLSLLSTTLESSSDAMLVVDLNNIWVLYNQKFIDLWHITDEIIAAKDDNAALLYVLNQLEDAAGFLHKVQELYHTPAASSFDIIHFKQGKIVERYSIPQRVNGEVVGRVWSFRDITERAQAERALQRESEKNLALLRNASDGIHILDFDGNIIEVSDSFCTMLGYRRDEIIGMNVTQWDVNFSVDDCLRVVRQQFANPVRALFETRHRCKDGRIIDVEVSGYPLELDGKPALFNSSRDITDRKQVEQALKESELKFKTVANFAYDWEYWVGTEGQVIYISASCERISGYKAEEFLADRLLLKKIIHPDDEKLWDAHAGKAHFFDEVHETDELDFKIIKKDGSIAYIGHLCRPVFDDKGHSLGRRVSNRDVTERKQAEAALRIAATVFESQEGMMITDANEIILNVNRAFTKITGYSADDVIGKTPHILHSGHQNKEFYKAIWQDIYDTGAWQGEIWNRRKNGEVYPEQLTITAVKSSDNIVTHYVATLFDITERKATEEYIHHLAFYDQLTQLPNRRLLQERLKHGIELNRRTGSQMAVLMIDLDKFKAVNDTLGHAAGDQLLQQVAKRIKARLRKVDLVARLGGDEFVILIENASRCEDVAHIADVIIHTLSQPFTLSKDHEVFIGATIGIAIHPQHGSDVDVLMDNADAALYHAKNQGRGCFACFSEEMTRKI
jgi:diguanylate cyclase (GGDEF)-like protein/PAS domain S-box-containing protein